MGTSIIFIYELGLKIFRAVTDWYVNSSNILMKIMPTTIIVAEQRNICSYIDESNLPFPCALSAGEWEQRD